MSDSIVLVCAVLAAMTFGVLAAYGVCLGFFRMFQMGVTQSPIPTAPVVVVAQVVQG